MYRAKYNADEGIRGCPKVNKNDLIGYKMVQEFFVDSSGFGTDGEPALTFKAFLGQVKAGFYYGITRVGQFQVYIGEFVKTNRADQLKELNIISTKRIKNNTRLTEYTDGLKVLTLHNTDIIKWINGKVILNSGGWRTATTKARLNEFLADSGIYIYQKAFAWYIRQKDQTIPFKDNIELNIKEV